MEPTTIALIVWALCNAVALVIALAVGYVIVRPFIVMGKAIHQWKVDRAANAARLEELKPYTDKAQAAELYKNIAEKTFGKKS